MTTPDQEWEPTQEQDVTDADEPQVNRKYTGDFSIQQSDINTIHSPQLKCLVNQSIAINSTAFEDIDLETKVLMFVGSKTETALPQFAGDLNWENWKEICKLAKIIPIIPL
jgi:Ca2+-transporting ATPase